MKRSIFALWDRAAKAKKTAPTSTPTPPPVEVETTLHRAELGFPRNTLVQSPGSAAAARHRSSEDRARWMGDNEARGDDLVKKAERKLSGWGLVCNKYEDAADLLEKAATFFRIAKNWSRAAGVYNKIADCHLKGYRKYECIYRKHEAAYAYVEAATCYKKFSPKDAAQALIDAVNLFLESGELTMAATYNEDIGEIYQQEQDLENAAVYLNRAADLYDSNGDSFELDKIAKKIAEINAQLEKYQEAAELFEEIARKSKTLTAPSRGHTNTSFWWILLPLLMKETLPSLLMP